MCLRAVVYVYMYINISRRASCCYRLRRSLNCHVNVERLIKFECFPALPSDKLSSSTLNNKSATVRKTRSYICVCVYEL